MKYHIGKDGKPAKCTASKKACPLSDNPHFDSKQEADNYYKTQMESQYGLLNDPLLNDPLINKEIDERIQKELLLGSCQEWAIMQKIKNPNLNIVWVNDDKDGIYASLYHAVIERDGQYYDCEGCIAEDSEKLYTFMLDWADNDERFTIITDMDEVNDRLLMFNPTLKITDNSYDKEVYKEYLSNQMDELEDYFEYIDYSDGELEEEGLSEDEISSVYKLTTYNWLYGQLRD